MTTTIGIHGYAAPVLSWTVNGVEIPAGNSEIMLSNVDTVEGYNPVTSDDPDWSPVIAGPVTLHASLHNRTLAFTNTPADGNYQVEVRVTCLEFGEMEVAATGRTSFTVAFLGRHERSSGSKRRSNAAYQPGWTSSGSRRLTTRRSPTRSTSNSGVLWIRSGTPTRSCCSGTASYRVRTPTWQSSSRSKHPSQPRFPTRAASIRVRST